ncbi:MAG: twitch domain-containing radical SAM protein [Chitinophagales bacterium]|nr:twitch domain-containing radical SAM protein [Chitinophagales bacterium]
MPSSTKKLYKSIKKKLVEKAFDLDKRTKNDTFCMSPWVQLHAQTNGMVAPCCMASTNEETKLADLNDDPNLVNAWNSDKMKELRLNMLKGKKSSICENCYKYEALGNISERMKYNRDFKEHYKRVLRTQKDGSLPNDDVLILDMRFSNKCNYKCRICDSSYSSQWYDEEQKLGKKPLLPSAKKMIIAADKQSFDDSFYHSLRSIQKIHFAGGEPLVMDEHFQVLDYLIQKKMSHVHVSYNTNFSSLKYKDYDVIKMWNQFELIDIWASLDGMFERGDYMRKGQRWHKIEENIHTVQKECHSVLFGVNITVSILNVFHLPEFITYLIEQKFVYPDRINLYLLFYPAYYNLTQLPPHIKKKATDELYQFRDGFVKNIKETNHLAQHIDYIINYMNSEQGIELHKARYWLTKVDELRRENFEDTFPELRFLLDENIKGE